VVTLLLHFCFHCDSYHFFVSLVHLGKLGGGGGEKGRGKAHENRGASQN